MRLCSVPKARSSQHAHWWITMTFARTNMGQHEMSVKKLNCLLSTVLPLSSTYLCFLHLSTSYSLFVRVIVLSFFCALFRSFWNPWIRLAHAARHEPEAFHIKSDGFFHGLEPNLKRRATLQNKGYPWVKQQRSTVYAIFAQHICQVGTIPSKPNQGDRGCTAVVSSHCPTPLNRRTGCWKTL